MIDALIFLIFYPAKLQKIFQNTKKMTHFLVFSPILIHLLTQKQAFLRVYIWLHNLTFLNKTFKHFIGWLRRITRTECNALNALAEEMAGG
jgi:hypothetical protein